MDEKIELFMNGQEVKLKNPGTKGLGDFLRLTKALSKMPQPKNKEEEEEQAMKFMDYLDDTAIESAVRLINLTLDKTFPDMNQDEKEAWGMENAMLILPKIAEMCTPKGKLEEAKRKRAMMEKLNGPDKPDTEQEENPES
jgi:hypothetical protein